MTERIDKKMENLKKQKHNFDCVVNLRRIPQREHELYSNSSVIISKIFNIKIKQNHLKIGQSEQYSASNTFELTFKRRMNEFVLENSTEKPAPTPTSTFTPASKPESSLAVKSKVRADSAKTLTALITDTWKICKRDFLALNKPALVGDIVMAKMKSFSAWPGRIEGFTKDKKRAQIYFFGTHDIGSVEVKEIVAFNRSENMIRLLLLRVNGPFHKGILEIEALLGIPHEHSLLRERCALE